MLSLELSRYFSGSVLFRSEQAWRDCNNNRNDERPGSRQRRQNASAHNMTSAAVEMMIPSAAFARSRRVGNRDLAGDEFEMVLDDGEIGSCLIGLAQCERVFL
jgi:hypothetical protein